MNNIFQSSHNPDVLSTFSNLSNDEVFTPPKVVNEMLDMLPQSLFNDKNTKFLDPASKSGVFLREIAKRLLEGLKEEIPILQERIDHIFHNQLYGIAITELTSLLSRRTLYCSKYPNSKYSISIFDNPYGNIRFQINNHIWEKNRCKVCGATKAQFYNSENRENHAYEFIHTIPGEYKKMRFDVIIGNPPYQVSDGGAQSSAKPIYNLFIENAKKLKPKYLVMITPSRWFNGGKGLDDFRIKVINETKYRKIVDYTNSKDVFPGVQVEGGVNYFLWDRDYDGKCEVVNHISNFETSVDLRYLNELNLDIFVRYNKAVSILRKVIKRAPTKFSSIVSSRKPYKLDTTVVPEDRQLKNSIILYGHKKRGYINIDKILKNQDNIFNWKIFISMAYGYSANLPYQVLNKPFLGEPGSACTETYLEIGTFSNKKEAERVLSYMRTKFFRFLVMLRKSTQHATKQVYDFVPMLESNIEIIKDSTFYSYYDLNVEEIDFIEKLIKKMDND